MCHETTCHVCGKTTWEGCGEHIDEVKAGVPVGQWCGGHDDPQNNGWLRRMFR